MTSLDFAPLLAPGLPPPAVKFNGFPKYNFTGGHNDGEQIPLDAIVKAANDVLTREGRTLATYGLESGPQGYRRLREFLAQKLKRTAGISCDAGEILITSGSLQALDLVNGILLARGDTIITEAETYQGALNRWTRLGVNAVGIPLDGDGMRMDALAAALDDLKRRGIRPKYIYTVPTVQNPTGTILSEARRLDMLRLAEQHGVPIFEDDCYSDLIWDGQRPPALHALSQHGGVIHIGSFSKSIAPALRVGYIVADWSLIARMLAIKTDAGSGALEQMVLGEFCPAHFDTTRAGIDARPAQEARNFDGRAQRAVRHRRRIRRSEGRHFPLGQAAGRSRYAETLSAGARRRRRHQSGAGMDHRQGLRQKPDAVVLRQSIPRSHPRRRRRFGRSLPPRIRRAEPDCQCGAGAGVRRHFAGEAKQSQLRALGPRSEFAIPDQRCTASCCTASGNAVKKPSAPD